MLRIMRLIIALAMVSSVTEANAFLDKSPVIAGIDFAPANTIKRFAPGSDNWPMTWGDDGNIYTAYGDGWGFEAIGQGSKVRLGISRIDGTPDNPKGKDLAQLATWDQNIANIKATDIIMIDGILYLWSRRDGGTLRKSTDRGKSWMDTGITMEQSNGDFHSLAFTQFGRNYEDPRDDYLYVFGTSHESKSVGQIYLFKVLRSKLEERPSYLFFSGFGLDGSPTWSSNIDARQPVILDTAAKKAHDPRIVFNPGINRYLLTYWFGDDGGIAILDAPEPWGPWTMVHYEPRWDHGFTFEYTFPRKWMSTDGLTMYMAFSGVGENDALVVRQVNLYLAVTAGGHPTPTSVPASLPPTDSGGSPIDEEIEFITCSSVDYKTSSCPTGIYATSIELDKQLSNAACTYGISWRFTASEISVTDGCRAVFMARGLTAGTPPLADAPTSSNPPGNTLPDEEIRFIACSSVDYKTSSCPTGIYATSIELDKQLSNAACTYGISWRFTASEISVTDGCRAVFMARGLLDGSSSGSQSQ